MDLDEGEEDTGFLKIKRPDTSQLEDRDDDGEIAQNQQTRVGRRSEIEIRPSKCKECDKSVVKQSLDLKKLDVLMKNLGLIRYEHNLLKKELATFSQEFIYGLQGVQSALSN